ncbi:MAG TPA: tRNA pseudouridine(38-40) synthase TruA [Marmoricola sp.]|nr:tRNA pseudouridine(38-40) synthase TruA [Nocardioidaceae bacterium]MCB8993416.1 tRNA pseudouridine(38-40) synthase TruA [Nocardioidaceae bacterium]MCO5324398.1 tRNA pseudouridine(38-40) synthase TruA [Nocardioidaceae bacterium]HMU36192.1 tRNA pseudouridine(38-40) synthase TruA [Marmoricola sp.]HRV68571.1 tRNA pseudouridine(38-40) synthase TruA [Marmoricola sp.]
MRLRLDLSYDGAGFHGWATQPDLRTVQGELTSALQKVLRVEEIQLTVAGRTDTGVHARGQVAHFDLAPAVLESVTGRSDVSPLASLVRRVNGVLEPDIRVRAIAMAAEGFDARFSAIWRRYCYRIADHAGCRDPLTRGFVLHWPRNLDEALMNDAAEALLGEHDFAAFCKRREGATTIRTLLDLEWERDQSGVLVGTVRADAFCHNMVRSLVGCLIAIGEGRKPVTWAAQILEARARDSAVGVVAAHGLTLEEVGYPDDLDLADQAKRSRVVRTLSR